MKKNNINNNSDSSILKTIQSNHKLHLKAHHKIIASHKTNQTHNHSPSNVVIGGYAPVISPNSNKIKQYQDNHQKQKNTKMRQRIRNPNLQKGIQTVNSPIKSSRIFKKSGVKIQQPILGNKQHSNNGLIRNQNTAQFIQNYQNSNTNIYGINKKRPIFKSPNTANTGYPLQQNASLNKKYHQKQIIRSKYEQNPYNVTYFNVKNQGSNSKQTNLNAKTSHIQYTNNPPQISPTYNQRINIMNIEGRLKQQKTMEGSKSVDNLFNVQNQKFKRPIQSNPFIEIQNSKIKSIISKDQHLGNLQIGSNAKSSELTLRNNKHIIKSKSQQSGILIHSKGQKLKILSGSSDSNNQFKQPNYHNFSGINSNASNSLNTKNLSSLQKRKKFLKISKTLPIRINQMYQSSDFSYKPKQGEQFENDNAIRQQKIMQQYNLNLQNNHYQTNQQPGQNHRRHYTQQIEQNYFTMDKTRVRKNQQIKQRQNNMFPAQFQSVPSGNFKPTRSNEHSNLSKVIIKGSNTNIKHQQFKTNQEMDRSYQTIPKSSVFLSNNYIKHDKMHRINNNNNSKLLPQNYRYNNFQINNLNNFQPRYHSEHHAQFKAISVNNSINQEYRNVPRQHNHIPQISVRPQSSQSMLGFKPQSPLNVVKFAKNNSKHNEHNQGYHNQMLNNRPKSSFTTFQRPLSNHKQQMVYPQKIRFNMVNEFKDEFTGSIIPSELKGGRQQSGIIPLNSKPNSPEFMSNNNVQHKSITSQRILTNHLEHQSNPSRQFQQQQSQRYFQQQQRQRQIIFQNNPAFNVITPIRYKNQQQVNFLPFNNPQNQQFINLTKRSSNHIQQQNLPNQDYNRKQRVQSGPKQWLNINREKYSTSQYYKIPDNKLNTNIYSGQNTVTHSQEQPYPIKTSFDIIDEFPNDRDDNIDNIVGNQKNRSNYEQSPNGYQYQDYQYSQSEQSSSTEQPPNHSNAQNIKIKPKYPLQKQEYRQPNLRKLESNQSLNFVTEDDHNHPNTYYHRHQSQLKKYQSKLLPLSKLYSQQEKQAQGLYQRITKKNDHQQYQSFFDDDEFLIPDKRNTYIAKRQLKSSNVGKSNLFQSQYAIGEDQVNYVPLKNGQGSSIFVNSPKQSQVKLVESKFNININSVGNICFDDSPNSGQNSNVIEKINFNYQNQIKQQQPSTRGKQPKYAYGSSYQSFENQN